MREDSARRMRAGSSASARAGTVSLAPPLTAPATPACALSLLKRGQAQVESHARHVGARRLSRRAGGAASAMRRNIHARMRFEDA